MNNLIQNTKSRLKLIEDELKNTILSYMYKRRYDNYIEANGLTINNHKITHLSYNDGQQFTDVDLYYDKDNYEYIRLSDITNVYDLMKIIEYLN